MANNKITEEQYKRDIIDAFIRPIDKKIIVGKIDLNWDNLIHFEVKNERAKAKDMLSQIIVTTYQELKRDEYVKPPNYFGAIDTEFMYLVEYKDAILNNNAPYWNETPSNLSNYTKEEIFKTIGKNVITYNLQDKNKINDILSSIRECGRVQISTISKNNFTQCFYNWKNTMLFTPSPDDSTLVELFFSDIVRDNALQIQNKDATFTNTLFKVYEGEGAMKFEGKTSSKNEGKVFTIKERDIYEKFWNDEYRRPPQPDDFKLIVERRASLLPTENRQRTGAEYTPLEYVNKSMEYLNNTLGDNWQENYIIYDMCAGVGNLEHYLLYKENIYLSTLDYGDVAQLKNKGFPNVKEFDYLKDWNEPFKINEIAEKQGKKLLVLINPPYAESTEAGAKLGGGKAGTSQTQLNDDSFKKRWGKSSNELFTQFLAKIYTNIPDCKIAVFSKT
ncbi:MAG: hypothetical protein LBH46_01435, partial [Rickettsiales bacterium]|nr:hypothetical protein [Rickettsiales bacterium]